MKVKSILSNEENAGLRKCSKMVKPQLKWEAFSIISLQSKTAKKLTYWYKVMPQGSKGRTQAEFLAPTQRNAHYSHQF